MELTAAPRRNLEQLQGQSLLLPALDPARASADRTVFCAIASQHDKMSPFLRRSVRSGRYVLFEDVLSGRRMLYDSTSDPRETVDLIDVPAQQNIVNVFDALLRRVSTGNLASHVNP